MSLESLYHETNRQLSEAQSRMGELDRMTFTSPSPDYGDNNVVNRGADKINSVQKEISARIEQVIRNCERLDILVQKEPAAGSRRQNAKVRVDQLKADVKHLQSSFRSLQARQWQREREIKERDQLMNMRFTTNAEAAKNSNGTEQSSTSILIDRAIEHNDRLTKANRGLDDMISHGSIMLESLRNQRETIKGFRRKMLDVASVLGMSNTVMRLVERRSQGDKYVLFGGMLFTCLVMYIVIRNFT